MRWKRGALIKRPLQVGSHDNFYNELVFGHLQQEPFSAWEAAQYLEVSVPTLRRYVQSGKLVPSHVVGRNQMFSVLTLRAFKRMSPTLRRATATA